MWFTPFTGRYDMHGNTYTFAFLYFSFHEYTVFIIYTELYTYLYPDIDIVLGVVLTMLPLVCVSRWNC